MAIWALVLGAAIIAIVLWDAFETIVLPRRVTRRLRLARLFYRSTWLPWAAMARHIRSRKRREAILGFFGPLSLIFLLSVWALGLVFGFALVQFGLGSALRAPGMDVGFGTDLYVSGTTLFTLGLGDVTPTTTSSRVIEVLESGVGFGFLAIVIGYLPVVYQSFSRREVNISLLDARAGSPPTAAELLRRHSQDHGLEELQRLLYEWERWSADLLESAVSYPVLCYFRSQHDNQSWLAALTTILDTCALTIVGIEGACSRQAQLTFAIARHAVVDLAQIFQTRPRAAGPDRLPTSDLVRLRNLVRKDGLSLYDGPGSDEKLAELRKMYEPYVQSLANYLLLSLPQWIAGEEVIDNWKTSAWGRISGFSPSPSAREDHM
jgi:ion channel